MADWKPITKPPRNTSESDPVDLWIDVPASPLSMGMSDSWRVPDCWKQDGKWVHRHNGEIAELNADYLTHWIRPPKPPSRGQRKD